GSIELVSILRSVGRVVARLTPSTESEPIRDSAASAGEPARQRALASALTPETASSGPAGAASAFSAGRRSTVPIGVSITPPPGRAERSGAGTSAGGAATVRLVSPAEALAT